MIDSRYVCNNDTYTCKMLDTFVIESGLIVKQIYNSNVLNPTSLVKFNFQCSKKQ